MATKTKKTLEAYKLMMAKKFYKINPRAACVELARDNYKKLLCEPCFDPNPEEETFGNDGFRTMLEGMEDPWNLAEELNRAVENLFLKAAEKRLAKRPKKRA